MMLSYVFPGGRKKVLTFSYDDGNDSDRRLSEIFYNSAMKCTFNINSGSMAWDGKVHAEELKSVFLDRGHEVAVHGKCHPIEEQIPYQSVVEDILDDRRALEEALGIPVTGMAYPFGTMSPDGAVLPEVKNILRALGIVYARTVRSTHKFHYFPTDFLEWHPSAHHRENIMELGESFVSNPWGLQMLYIWGHAYEFENAKNWHIIEDFCTKFSGNDKIWYATNGEIYDYLKACRSLIIGADGKVVKNPSFSSVWIEHKGGIFEIPGGATVNF